MLMVGSISSTSSLRILSGHIEIVKFLVEHGAEVDVTDYFDDTPLHVAARNGKYYNHTEFHK